MRRLLEGIPLLIGITLVIYLVLVSIPGGPLAAYRNNPRVRAQDLERLGKQLGLDQPVYVRYGLWLGKFIQGDWGYSYVTRQPVLVMIWERFVNTIYLMGVSLLLTLLLAIPIGVYSAVRQYSLFDHAMTGLAFMGYSMPAFWLGLLLMLLFSVQWRWLPAGGMFTIGTELVGFSALLDRLRYLVLPVMTLSIVSAGFYARYLRASLLDVMGQDYVRTARAKGLRERRVIVGHALKNAAIPFLTVVALHMPQLFTGAVVVETVFAWPGIGRLFWDSALRFDYPALMGVLAIVSLAMLLLLITSALLAPWIAPYDPNAIDLKKRYWSPSFSHLMGTDDLGRDLLSRVIHGGRISLSIGILSALVAVVFGTLLGALAGYYGRWLDAILMRFTDLMLTFPPLLLLILLASLVGTSFVTIVLVISTVSWMNVARLVRASFLSLKEQDFVEASRALGAGSRRLIFTHILPNSLSPIIVATTLGAAAAILTESTLSYLGLGIQPPTSSWGTMLQTAQSQISIAPWTSVFPGLMIFLTVLSINFLGDGLRDALDPRKVI